MFWSTIYTYTRFTRHIYSYWHLHAQHSPESICVYILRSHNGTGSTRVIASTMALFSTEMCLPMACPYHGRSPSTYMVGNYWGPIHRAGKPRLLHRVMPYCHAITVLIVWICLKPQRHFSNMYVKRTSKAWRRWGAADCLRVLRLNAGFAADTSNS